ncbi:hypothetical protein IMSAGC007_03985 [Lachnospiraceae bacterium]|nr:hypothetical protein IMSAGC007_03985 [Lachnospiraceae bacterium]
MVNIALIDDEAAILENVRKCVENEIAPQEEVNLLLIHWRRIFFRRWNRDMSSISWFQILICPIWVEWN